MTAMMEMMPSSAREAHNVVALVYDGLSIFEYAVAAELFGLSRPEAPQIRYSFSAYQVDQNTDTQTIGLKFTAGSCLDALEAAHTIIVPGWPVDGPPACRDIIQALQRAHDRGARLVSFCSGAFLLAEAGLLDGRRAATHWVHSDTFRQRFPSVRLQDNVLYTDDGGVLTSAGSAAAIDLGLHIVRSDYGVDAANAVARRLVTSPVREGGQAQFVERPVPRPASDARLQALIQSLPERLTEDLSIEVLASEAAMSRRSFIRRFKAATGSTPGAWVAALRISHARWLLETSNLSIEIIATECGFERAAALRERFRAMVGLSPSEYRERFARGAARACCPAAAE